jgi:uncharacterized protein YaaQ
MLDTETQELQTDITVQDLRVILNIIELATSKGLLKAADLTIVGKIHDKILDSIKSAKNEN